MTVVLFGHFAILRQAHFAYLAQKYHEAFADGPERSLYYL